MPSKEAGVATEMIANCAEVSAGGGEVNRVSTITAKVVGEIETQLLLSFMHQRPLSLIHHTYTPSTSRATIYSIQPVLSHLAQNYKMSSISTTATPAGQQPRSFLPPTIN